MPIGANVSRRTFVGTTALTLGSVVFGDVSGQGAAPDGFRPLFDGRTLTGWHPLPRVNVPNQPGQSLKPQPDDAFARLMISSTGIWKVIDGMLVGGQSLQRMEHPSQKVDWGFGGWLMTDELFGDFELLIDARPDWPCDTGIYVRSTALGQGFQVLLDHRGDDAKGVGGSIGFIYCKGIGSMRVDPNNFRWTTGPDGLPNDVQLIPGTDGVTRVEHSCTSEEFRRAWRLNDWNTFRIRVTGNLPRITTWINGVKICECDTAAIQSPSYDAPAVKALLGPRGHIALEVHDGPPNRWGVGKVARWRNMLLKAL